MALERRELHDELVALIAAGRELPPEHDRALADIFLSHAQFRSAPPPPQSSLLKALQDWRVVAGALLLALAAFLFGTGFGHAAGPNNDQLNVFPVHYGDGDDDGGFHDGPWQHKWPPFNQAPSQPSDPSNPSIPGA